MKKAKFAISLLLVLSLSLCMATAGLAAADDADASAEASPISDATPVESVDPDEAADTTTGTDAADGTETDAGTDTGIKTDEDASQPDPNASAIVATPVPTDAPSAVATNEGMPKTGDSTNFPLYIAIAAVCAGAIAFAAFRVRAAAKSK